jgi:hypothetical protein
MSFSRVVNNQVEDADGADEPPDGDESSLGATHARTEPPDGALESSFDDDVVVRRRAHPLLAALLRGFVFGVVLLIPLAWLALRSRPVATAARHHVAVAALRVAAPAPVLEVTEPAAPPAPSPQLSVTPRPLFDATASREHAVALPRPALDDSAYWPKVADDGHVAEGPWAKAAHALADSDFDRAERTLRALGTNSDPKVRDAADLALAQVWISRGQGAEFRPTVERLAASGSTPLVRSRAADLLRRLPPLK